MKNLIRPSRQYCGYLSATVLWVSTHWLAAADFDLILRGGTVYDGSGAPPQVGDVAVRNDRIAALGDLSNRTADRIVDVRGLAVAPGFINMLSWAVDSLIEDGRSESDIRQGVTLEVFGEGVSWGPWNERLKQWCRDGQSDIRYEIEWTTLNEYLEYLARKGVACNVASFVGATTLRIHELGFEDRAPSRRELARMKQLVRQAMEEGALGVASSLIYAPAFYAKTEELIELCRVAAEYDGLYITHLRSEGNRLEQAVEEALKIARTAGIRTEIYHLKAAGQANWPKLDTVISRIERARAEGLAITADMYTYTAAATGLDASMPPWVQEGGYNAWVERLRDPKTRLKVLREMATPSDEWENLLLLTGSPDKVLLVGFRNEQLKPLTGKTLAEVATLRGKSPEETAIELVIEDGSRVETVYFLMSEENIKRQIRLPWVSFCSDAASLAPEGVFLKSGTHPRAYGNFARLLGKYVRDEQVISLAEAVRRLTSLPATTLRLEQRGLLKPGYFADVVVFDAETIQDHATYAQPHQLATGMVHVWVNGQAVIADCQHTGATPGRVVHGPGRRR
jgi:N-acyl-D-amino-acid deacylase